LAHAIRQRGVGKGDRVAVMLGNGWECGVASYACWKAGAVLVSWSFRFLEFSGFVICDLGFEEE